MSVPKVMNQFGDNRNKSKMKDKSVSSIVNSEGHNNIEALKQQVEIALHDVDENMIDSLMVGQTAIQKNKAVILSWSMDQNKNSEELNSVKSDEDDGIVLYVAIKMKKNLPSNDEDENNNSNHRPKSASSVSQIDQSKSVVPDPEPSNNCENKTNSAVKPSGEREVKVRSALRRRRAKKNWLRLVTTMRNVNIADCENMFVKDEYRHIRISEDDLISVMNGEYQVKTPPLDDDDDDSGPNKRVTWRESLEEAFYDDTEDECVVVNLDRNSKESRRSQLRRQFSVGDRPMTSSERPMTSGGHSHSAPSSPAKSPVHRPGVRSRSADRSSSSGRGTQNNVETRQKLGHSHVYDGDLENKVRRVRCQHSSTNKVLFLTRLTLRFAR